MTSLAFICEGKTERNFVEEVIAPHLKARGIESVPSEIGQEFLQPGGNVSLARVVRDVENHLANSDYVTTVVDFYGMATDWVKCCGGDIHQKATQEKAEIAESAALKYAISHVNVPDVERRFIPNVLMHEFEGLLLTSPETIVTVTRNTRALCDLAHEIEGFDSPEDINTGRDTAPSKRLKKCKANYGKTFHGARIAAVIGLAAIRSSCPHFNRWMERIETLGALS